MQEPRAAIETAPGGSAFRLSAVFAAVTGLLGAAPASAATIDTFFWGSNNAGYNAWAVTCPTCGPSGTAPVSGVHTTVNRSEPQPTDPPATAPTLFSWGDNSDAFKDYNSTLTWTNDGAAFTLEGISIAASGTVGTGTGGWSTGTGALPPYEWSANSKATWVTEAQLGMIAGSTSVFSGNLFQGAVDGQTWFDVSQTTPRQTPITFSQTIAPTLIGAGETISLRLFESYWDGETQNRPDVQYAPMTIQFLGTPLGGTPVLTASDVSFGDVRIGTTSQSLATTISETAGFAATGVALSGAGAPFTPPGTVSVGTIQANSSATSGYTFTPPVAADPQHGALTSSTIDVTATNAAAVQFDVSGTGVGPVFDFSGDGVSALTVDLGTVEVGKTRTYNLALKNLFLDNLTDDALSDLTIINVGGIPGLGSPVQVTGLPTLPFVIDSQGSGDPLNILTFALSFTPTQAGGIAPLMLRFYTDVNCALYTSGSTCQTEYDVTVYGSGAGPVPVPGTLALVGMGVVLLRRRRGKV